MKKILLITLMLTATFGATAQKAVWENLFNGNNLDGWKQLGGAADYKVVDATIVGTTKTGTSNSFLTTTKNYGDFILEFDVLVSPGLNSGVQFRSESYPEYRNGQVHGYQFELDTAPRAWSAGIYDEGRRMWIYPMVFNQPGRAAFKNDEWNHARIEAIGNSIRTWLNGIECANLVDDVTPSGFIALQVHGIGSNKAEEGKTISWKNIRICTTKLEKVRTPENKNVPEVNRLTNLLSKREQEEGWKLLWDGKTNEGWRAAKSLSFPVKGWNITDGVLSVEKSGGGESTNGGDIITVKKYRNFILKVDFKITKGANSGIKYFVDPEINKGEGSAIGCEFQLLDDNNHPDAKLGVKGNRTLASLYDLIPSQRENQFFFDMDSWSTAMIVITDNHVEHWLNGTKVVEYDRNNQMWNALVDYSKYRDWADFGNFTEGHILLQDHGDAVQFKNIKIKEL